MERIVLKTFEWNFEQLCKLINNYQEKILDIGLEKGTSISEQQVKFSYGIFTDSKLLIGAYFGGELLALIGLAPILVKFRQQNLIAAGVGRWGLDPIILSQVTQGRSDKDKTIFEESALKIFQKLIKEVIDRAKNSGIDFLYAFPVLEESEPIAKFLEENAGWLCLSKNVENVTKLMGKEGVDIIKEKRGLNILEAQAAKLVAKIKKDRIQSGILRKANEKDIPEILELLNNYSKIHEVARIWKKEEFQAYLKTFEELDRKKYESIDEFSDTPFGSGITVWEDNGKIKAAVIFELNEIYLKKGFAPILFIHQLAFSDEILKKEPKEIKKEKHDFMGSFLAPYHRKISTVYALLHYYDEKAFKGFLSERRTTRFLVKILSEKASSLNNVKKFKKFYLNYVGFTIP